MERDKILDAIKNMIQEMLHKDIQEQDADLFGSISPVNMVYLLFSLEEAFSIQLNDSFMDRLPSITLNHLADAVCSGQAS